MVEQILEVEEILLAVSPKFLVGITKWMVAGSVLGKLVNRRRKDLKRKKFSPQNDNLELPVKFHSGR